MKGEPTRHRLHALLCEACELEHALGCSYLFAAFSIKRELTDGIDWRQQQILRRWQSQIYHVAAQEMLHFAQAWNLLQATGGTICYDKPEFPHPARHYPLNVALLLRRFDVATMERFVYYEHPGHEDTTSVNAPASNSYLWPTDESFQYNSVGELYAECHELIEALPEDTLFIGSDELQVGEALIDFPDLVAVADRKSALLAIERIVLQGEGTPEDRGDSHFAVFREILAQLEEWGDPDWTSRPVADNPYLPGRRDVTSPAAMPSTPITNPTAIAAIDLFDDTYVLMLQALEHTFGTADRGVAKTKLFADVALQLMVTVIKPLGESVCLLPSGRDGLNAGPTFAIARHVSLPSSGDAAHVVVHERLLSLAKHGLRLSRTMTEDPHAATLIEGAAANLARIASEFADERLR